MKYASTQKLKFITVPFEDVVTEILRRVDNRYMGVVLKRLMLQAAQKVWAGQRVKALVTGEAVAQVSSQTLSNLAVIDEASDTLVLRPLAFMDKSEIIDIARRIGTEDFSKHIPEYCGVISRRPRTRAKLADVLREEARFNPAVLAEAVSRADVQFMHELAEQHSSELHQLPPMIGRLEDLPQDSRVLDIRHPAEQDERPLRLGAIDVVTMPFYELNAHFSTLPADRTYFLYCEQGMMSRLHASYLYEAGHTNVAIYRPSDQPGSGY